MKLKNRWMLVPKTMAAGFLKDNAIETRDIAFEVPTRITNCLYRTADQANPLIQSFMKAVQKEMEKLAAKSIIQIVKDDAI